MSLYSRCVNGHDLVQRIKGDIAKLGSGINERFAFKDIVQTRRILLSRLDKNFPRMLIAITRKPVSASISSTVNTVSYRMEFPTFFVESVLVATSISNEHSNKITGGEKTHLR